MTNETIASQLAHRTIRAYKDQPLTEEEGYRRKRGALDGVSWV